MDAIYILNILKYGLLGGHLANGIKPIGLQRHFYITLETLTPNPNTPYN